MKKIGFVLESKKGNRYFKIGKKTYVILQRPKEEIGNRNNYAKEEIYVVDKL